MGAPRAAGGAARALKPHHSRRVDVINEQASVRCARHVCEVSHTTPCRRRRCSRARKSNQIKSDAPPAASMWNVSWLAPAAAKSFTHRPGSDTCAAAAQ